MSSDNETSNLPGSKLGMLYYPSAFFEVLLSKENELVRQLEKPFLYETSDFEFQSFHFTVPSPLTFATLSALSTFCRGFQQIIQMNS